MTELLPTKGTFRLDEPVEVEVREGSDSTRVSLWQLERKLDEVVVDTDAIARFGVLAPGGYGVESDDGAGSALDVLTSPVERFRYGFVSHYEAQRDVTGVVDNVRRLHLNAIQFYDWMYRHAELLPPQDEFEDALGRVVSLGTVRVLVDAVREAGALPIGYAAVYATGKEHWDEWREEGLYHPDGTPWTLGDFLWNVDPGSDRWLEHFTGQLRAAGEQAGFAGFHLDQFGAPKEASRLDGSVVDLSEAFPILIERVRQALPEATLVFNNVNDFPTWATAGAPQDAVYIEVWSPHDRLDHLAALVVRARAFAPGKSVSLAAYLSAYAKDPESARSAMRLELATVFSHGATCLLHGEEDAILTDPYYVRHHRMSEEAAEDARRFYDFAVRYGDMLFDRDAVDVTRSHSGGDNKEIHVGAPVPVATDCTAGSLWARAIRTRDGLVVSLIDLSTQDDVTWDAPKREGAALEDVMVSFERVAGGPPRIFFASPDDPRAIELESELREGLDVVRVPTFSTWALVWSASSERSGRWPRSNSAV